MSLYFLAYGMSLQDIYTEFNGRMIEKKLRNKGIEFELFDDANAMLEKGFKEVPKHDSVSSTYFVRQAAGRVPAKSAIERHVAKKQNRTNLISHTAEKSESDRSWNSSTGSAILNTNLFILLVNDSSRIPTFRKKSPKIIVRKIGIVAFRLKIRLLIPVFFLPVHFYNLRSSLREASAYSDRRDISSCRRRSGDNLRFSSSSPGRCRPVSSLKGSMTVYFVIFLYPPASSRS